MLRPRLRADFVVHVLVVLLLVLVVGGLALALFVVVCCCVYCGSVHRPIEGRQPIEGDTAL